MILFWGDRYLRWPIFEVTRMAFCPKIFSRNFFWQAVSRGWRIGIRQKKFSPGGIIKRLWISVFFEKISFGWRARSTSIFQLVVVHHGTKLKTIKTERKMREIFREKWGKKKQQKHCKSWKYWDVGEKNIQKTKKKSWNTVKKLQKYENSTQKIRKKSWEKKEKKLSDELKWVTNETGLTLLTAV